jgi:hypothetical protein
MEISDDCSQPTRINKSADLYLQRQHEARNKRTENLPMQVRREVRQKDTNFEWRTNNIQTRLNTKARSTTPANRASAKSTVLRERATIRKPKLDSAFESCSSSPTQNETNTQKDMHIKRNTKYKTQSANR